MLSDDDRIADLEEQVRYWREQALGSDTVAEKLRHGLGISPQRAWLLAALYARKGGVMPNELIVDEMPGRNDHVRETADINKVHICYLRKKLPPDSIVTDWGRGYSLSPIGLAHVASILGT